MRHSFFCRMQWFFLMVSLMGFWGCANMMEIMPTPPVFLVPVELNGPYDADIPIREANSIKNASLMLDWAVPYIFIRVATHFESAGDQERSIHFFNRAIDEFRKRNNAPGEGTAFSRKISVLVRLGNLQTAYLALEEQEKKWPKVPFNSFIFYNYGIYHFKNGDYARAHKYFGQALAANPTDPNNPDLLALRRDTELKYGMTLILADYFPAVSGRLGLSDFDEDFYQNIRRNISESLLHLEQVSALNKNILNTNVRRYFPEIIPSSMACDVHNFLGLTHGIAGNVPEAVKNLEMAVSIARKTDYHLGEADGIFFLNQVYLLDKNRSEGIKAGQALATIADRYNLDFYSIWANMILAHHYQGMGDIDPTINAMNKSLTLMEDHAPWLSCHADFRGIGSFKRQAIYEALLELHVGKNDERGAFKTAERSKAAMMADRLSGDVIGKTPVVLEGLKQMHVYRQQLTGHYKRILSPVGSAAVFMETVDKVDKTRRAYVKKLTEIKEQDEALYSLVGVVSPEMGDIQRLLDHNTTLFTYYVGEQYLYIWVISKNGFHQERIRMSRNDVDRLVHTYGSAMVSKNRSQADALAEKLYDTFLKPVIPFVYGDRVGFVPHGSLYNLPFASMRYARSYLVEGFTIFHLSHAGLLKHLPAKKRMPGAKKAIILADSPCVEKQPTVACAGEEIKMLKRIFPQADYVVQDASSKDYLQKLTGDYDMIHFVLNCYLTDETPFNSCLPPAATEARHRCLSIRDIFRLQLSGRTAVLSACQAGNGLSAKGPGMPALTSAWLYAVSPSVMTQLWEVEDKSKTALMGIFYKNLGKSGSATDALRAAQNGMIQRGYGSSDWAAFTINW